MEVVWPVIVLLGVGLTGTLVAVVAILIQAARE